MRNGDSRIPNEHENLTSEELDELLRCAKHLHWKVLDLSRCGLSDIPDTLEELEDLRVLDIGNTFSSINGDANIFTTLPDSIENLTNLQSLDLSFTPISALPDSVTRLTSLQKLSLSSANISTLPESIGNLTNLRWLYLGGTNISALPESIGNLTNLQSLYLSGTNISALPDSIGNLTNLQSLPLYRTSISALPDSIRNLTNLPELDLSGTNINVLPDFIGNLTNLKSLSLSESLISALPDSIGNLTSLQWLSLSESPISALPDSIGNLTNLQSLYLNGTNISALPDSIGNLKNLQLLYLSETDISMLPDSIGNLKNLRTLYLCSCHLQAIPYDVVTLGLPFVIDEYSSDKDCVNLTGVTLDEGDLQLFAQPQDVIEAYYRKQTQIRECKVIFLGDGGAGKTALIERITQGTFTPETPPTDGIETTNWFMSVEMTKWEDLEGDAPFILRFLDFGGQEIMHAAHRCFLTAHTIYVVVCDSRDDQKIDDIAAYWLQSVNLFAPDCPVILALNKADLNANVSVNERDLKTRNPALKTPYLRTSAKEEPDSRYGVNHLIEAIRDEIPRAVNDYKMNADMLSVKQALETMPDNYISSERYREICAKHHITDKKLQYDMLGFFRDLGVAYYYESKALDTRLESVRVLNPEWLTNSIYRLILRTREDGFLNHKEIKETLRATHAGDVHREITYKPKETEYILHVMRYTVRLIPA